jgi:hypothetical protein
MSNNQPFAVLLVVIAILVGLVVATVIGFMVKLSGDATVIALRQAGVAFTATVTVVLLIMKASALL